MSIPLLAQVSFGAFENQRRGTRVLRRGPITLPAMHRLIDLSYPSGKMERAELLVVYDQQGVTSLVAKPASEFPGHRSQDSDHGWRAGWTHTAHEAS